MSKTVKSQVRYKEVNLCERSIADMLYFSHFGICEHDDKRMSK